MNPAAGAAHPRGQAGGRTGGFALPGAKGQGLTLRTPANSEKWGGAVTAPRGRGDQDCRPRKDEAASPTRFPETQRAAWRPVLTPSGPRSGRPQTPTACTPLSPGTRPLVLNEEPPTCPRLLTWYRHRPGVF